MRRTQISTIGCTLTFLTILLASPVFGLSTQGVDIHGFIAQGFLKSDDNNYLAETEDGTLEFNEMGINFSTQINENFRLGTQFFARDMGPIGNDEVNVDWAFADYAIQDWLGIRAGILKIPFGLYNETRDIDLLRTSVLLPQGVYLEYFRDVLLSMNGIGTYGNISMGMLGSLNYQGQIGATDIDVDGGVTTTLKVIAPMNVHAYDVEDVLAGVLQWSLPFGLRLGYSVIVTDMKADISATPDLEYLTTLLGHYYSITGQGTVPTVAQGTPMTLDLDDVKATVYSAEYNWRNLTLSGEFFILNFTAGIRELGEVMPPDKREVEGWYGNLSYRLTDRFEIGFYYTELTRETGDRHGKEYEEEGDNLLLLEETLINFGLISGPAQMIKKHAYQMWLHDYCLSLRFDVNDAWTIKLEGHTFEGAAYVTEELNKEGDIPQYWNLFAAKVSYNF